MNNIQANSQNININRVPITIPLNSLLFISSCGMIFIFYLRIQAILILMQETKQT